MWYKSCDIIKKVITLNKEYSTGQIAEILRTHPNSVRWYDNMGLISPVHRTKSGYRKFNSSHLTQLRILRIIFKGTYSNKLIRNCSFAVLTALREKGKSDAIHKAQEYRDYLKKEYSSAVKAVTVLRKWMEGKIAYSPTGTMYNRKEAAKYVGVTAEVLRNWERNSLIAAPRTGKKNERVYSEADVIRMQLIYMLRQNNYSIAAIYSSLTRFDRGDAEGAALAINFPAEDPESAYMMACDYWLKVLEELMVDAEEMMEVLCD